MADLSITLSVADIHRSYSANQPISDASPAALVCTGKLISVPLTALH